MKINFASILAERTSAKRLFMLVAQMLKYIDATTPVRFLIAECETSLTAMAALYFAKLFGVDHKVDISPLFETTKAFERGIRVIDECLQNPTFAAYVRKRGRLCFQTGFSDAGRHLGQTVAAISVEWLRLKLGELMRDRGFGDVELVVFDTHGESIGRGGHPEDFPRSLEYVASPVSRHQFAVNGIRCKEEASFQARRRLYVFRDAGHGFGFGHAHSRIHAGSSLEHGRGRRRLQDRGRLHQGDFHHGPPLQRAGDGGSSLRHHARHLRRQPPLRQRLAPDPPPADGVEQRLNLTHPSQMRAIPHNGILQQMGLLANTVGGMGEAIVRDPSASSASTRASPRLRRLLGMVEWALEFTDLEALKSYIDLYDPGQWLSRAAQVKDADEAHGLRAVANIWSMRTSTPAWPRSTRCSSAT